MKKIAFLIMLATSLVSFVSCNKEEEIITIDTAVPQGTFSVVKQGTIVEQNSTGSKGLVQLGKDGKSTDFIRFGSDFTTVLATGTVTVYLSTSSTFKADPAKGNPDLKLIGVINKNGEMYIKMPSAPESKFTHLILWCGSANIPFGNAELK